MARMLHFEQMNMFLIGLLLAYSTVVESFGGGLVFMYFVV